MNHNPLYSLPLNQIFEAQHLPPGSENRGYSFMSLAPSNPEEDYVFFGLQVAIKELLVDCWENNFFSLSKEWVISDYVYRIKNSYNIKHVYTQHISDLHDLQRLPIILKAVLEGLLIQPKTPFLTLTATDPKFAWLTTIVTAQITPMLEVLISASSKSRQCVELYKEFATATADDLTLTPYAIGLKTNEVLRAASHLTSSCLTNSAHGLDLLELYYNASPNETCVGISIPLVDIRTFKAKDLTDELGTMWHFVNVVYPKGTLALTIDCRDLFRVITSYLMTLKSDIKGRPGKTFLSFGVRGQTLEETIQILVGDSFSPEDLPEHKGILRLLAKRFGTTKTKRGYMVLDEHIGLILALPWTVPELRAIYKAMERIKFAPSNVILNVKDAEDVEIRTETGGFVRVELGENKKFFSASDQNLEQERKGELQVHFECGEVCEMEVDLAKIRKRLGWSAQTY